MKTPEFSIIIPCYNHSQFLSDCFNSLIYQEFNLWEAILVNDGSSDDTERVGEEYASKDSRIHYFYQENQGLSAARNTGMRKASGDYLLFLDADDWLEVNCLATYKSYINLFPNTNLFRCGYAYWDKPNGRRYHTHSPIGFGKIWPEVLIKNIGPCHSILIHRSFAQKIGNFDVNLKSCEDRDFWIRAGKLGVEIRSIKDVLVAYRYVSTSMSRNAIVMYESHTKVVDIGMNIDSRLPNYAIYNVKAQCDRANIQKFYLIKIIGVLIHQLKVEMAINLFFKEKRKWKFEVIPSDWSHLSSYLSWRYFLGKNECEEIIITISPLLIDFFLGIGYDKMASLRISKLVLMPHYKKFNHNKYGRFLGGILNKVSYYTI